MRLVTPALLLLATPLAAQGAVDLVAQLRTSERRTLATAALARLGEPGARAVWDALAAAHESDPAAVTLAATLAELGAVTAPLAGRLVGALENAREPLFTHLLRALVNGVLDADGEAVDALRGALPRWAAAGRFYSAEPDAPTFAWQEYVRLQRRLALCAADAEPDALRDALAAIHRSRAEGAALFGGLGAAREYPVFDLNAHGQHGQREMLEAVAERAQRHGDAARALVEELARYLAYEPPRAGIVLTEHCAGIGENAPADLPAVQHPTLWRRDDWRFACARAVLALHPERGARTLALRQLLHAPAAFERMRALETVRQWPRPWDAFADDLAARLADDDRAVVREALITVGLDDAVRESLRAALERIAGSDDRELALLARKAAGRRQRGA
jgi:hypothetical protein